MATVKKPLPDAVREELRVLNNDASEAADTHNLLSWLTPDFWTMTTAAATNIIAVLVLVGWVQASHAQDVTQAVTAVIGATQVIIVNSVLVWKYLSGRQQLRARIAEVQYQYMAMVTCEKIRATSSH